MGEQGAPARAGPLSGARRPSGRPEAREGLFSFGGPGGAGRPSGGRRCPGAALKPPNGLKSFFALFQNPLFALAFKDDGGRDWDAAWLAVRIEATAGLSVFQLT